MSHVDKNNRGSEWRKWDLHVHTPASLRQNYGGATDEVWEQFITDLEKLPQEFKVIGINDYLFLDGYEKVLQYKKSGRLTNIDLILPVLEFRLAEFSGVDFADYKRPNIHVIFADESTLKPDIIKSQFLATLDAAYQLEKDGKKFHRTLTKESLIVFGQKIIDSVPAAEKSKCGTAEIEGFNNLNLRLEQIEESLKNDCFDGKYLLAIGKTEWDEMKWSDASIASKKNLINSCSIIFTSSASVESFQKAKRKLTEQEVKDLLLDCSDAHSFSDSKDKDDNPIKDRIGKCFTWIKADPTFEGLKQIIYEPLERVKIQESNPEEEKKHYKLKTLQISNSRNDLIVDQEIVFNSGLSSVIGGRGAGKSALLNLLVLFNGQKDNFIDWANENGDADLKCIFLNRDGQKEEYESKLSSCDNHSLPIYYLSQGNIEDFSTEKENVREEFLSTLGITENLYYYNDQISEAENLINNLRSLDIEEQEISDSYKKEAEGSNIKWEDFEKYYTCRKSVLEVQKKKYSTKETQDALEKISQISINGIRLKKILESEKISEIRTLASQLNKNIEEYFNLFIQEDDDLKKNIQHLTQYNVEVFEGQVSQNKTIIEKQLEELRKLASTEILKLKILGIQDYKNLTESIEKIDRSLIQLEKSKSRLVEIKEGKKDIKNKLIELSISYKENIKVAIADIDDKFREFRTDQTDLFNKIFEGVMVSGSVYFDVKKFKNLLKEEFYSGKADCVDTLFPALSDNDYEAFLNQSNNFWGILDEEKKHFKQNGYYDFLSLIFQNCMSHILVHPKIELYGRELGGMSGGQQATLLLKLKLASEGLQKDIIILDQPENHLDNKFITESLVGLLRELKKEKQVIIASHSANVVVGSDAEEVIVSRMDGEDKKYFSGSLENPEIQAEVIGILEGGKIAFEQRKKRYGMQN
ncbi:AAA family ATPase [Candidatus Gracilibacteria bacterium]|nr:AAA family ATPase [Candidatus Gracilibacteria bacterium]